MGERPNQPLGYWLATLDGLLDAAFDEALAADGLSRLHWQIFNTLAVRDLRTDQLGRALGPFAPEEPAALPELLADLRWRGWLTGERPGHNAITDEGRAAHARIAQRVGAIRQRLMSGLTPDDYTQCIEVLRRMSANLSVG